MRIKSPAGELDVVVGKTSVEGGYVVVDAGVGIWEIKVYLGPEDFKFFLSVFFRPGVILMLLKHFLPWTTKPPVPDSEIARNGNKDGSP